MEMATYVVALMAPRTRISGMGKILSKQCSSSTGTSPHRKAKAGNYLVIKEGKKNFKAKFAELKYYTYTRIKRKDLRGL